MARIRPKDIDIIKKLTGFQKSYFTLGDLEKSLGLKRESLYVALNRLVKSGVLIRLARNIYSIFTQPVDIEKIANELYFPSYLSFEQALAKYGILPQIPYTATFATTRPTKKMVISNLTVEYSHLKKELFFGYVLTHGKYIAQKEKALLDQLYMAGMGKRSINIEELDLSEINKEKFAEFAKKFPAFIHPLVNQVKKFIGTTPLTIEGKDRIVWGRKK